MINYLTLIDLIMINTVCDLKCATISSRSYWHFKSTTAFTIVTMKFAPGAFHLTIGIISIRYMFMYPFDNMLSSFSRLFSGISCLCSYKIQVNKFQAEEFHHCFRFHPKPTHVLRLFNTELLNVFTNPPWKLYMVTIAFS